MPLTTRPLIPVRHRPWPGRPPRVLLYSHDTFGLGHLRRNLNIATHLLQREGAYSVMLLTGSSVAESWPMPEGLQVRAMPPVVKTGVEAYASRDGVSDFAAVKARREAIILDAVVRFRPDVFLVDHAPAGMKGELLPALAHIRREQPSTLTVLGLRDIIDSPESVCGLWREQGIYALLDSAYDQVLVYGSRHLFDAVQAYEIPPAVAAKTRYCGYIARADRSGPAAPHLQLARAAPRPPVVLVTAGGGGDGYPLLSAYLQALGRLPPGAARSIVVTGPLMADGERRALEAMAQARPDVQMIACTTDMAEMIGQADLVVAMAGYNTTAEILGARKPAILVPRGAPRMEQRLRARLLSELGLVWAIQPEEDLIARLAALLGSAIDGGRPPCRDWNAIDLGGVHRVGSALDALLEPQALREARA